MTLLTGDCRAVLATLPAASVQCVVTSPPYFNLRSYLPDGHPDKAREIGTEQSPDAYVAEMVAVFREVKRVLRDDGTVWINLGSSYASSGRSRQSARALACDNDGTEPLGSPALDCAYSDLDDELTDGSENHRGYSADTAPQTGPERGPFDAIAQSRATLAYSELPTHRHDVQASTNLSSSANAPVSDGPEATSSACRSSLPTYARGVRGSARKAVRIADTSRQSETSVVRKQDKGLSSRACDCNSCGICWAYLAIPLLRFKATDLISTPHLVALALQADGWFLRSSIVWAKPNPMPESVTSRPTSAHEHVFLLSKRASYYWDSEAVAEPSEPSSLARLEQNVADQAGSLRANGGAKTNGPMRAVGGATRNLRNVWSIATQPYSGAHFACVDAETECLTAEGWKRHADMRVGMMAAQFDMASQKLSWAPVEKVATYEVADQSMVVGKCRDLDMWLTPNHRTVIQRRHPRSRDIQPPVMIRADELLASHSVPTAAEWDWQGDASLSLEWAELLGWYIAEGCESKGSLAVEIYQSDSANPGKCRRIEELLRQVGAEWTKATCDRTWKVGVVRKDPGPTRLTAYRVMGYAAVRLREIAPGKKLPWAAVMWSQERIAAVLQGLIEGDGHTRLDGRRCFIQKDKDQCDLVQALAIRLGFSATVSAGSGGIGVVYISKHTRRSFRGTNGRGAKPEVQSYTGVVWCPKLPHGTWVARRNGRPFITGNTMPPELAERCIKAGTSERGQCPHCAAPWARVVDVESRPNAPPCNGKYDGIGKHRTVSGGVSNDARARVDRGWQPTCACPEHTPVPQTVLDPFAGAGTTLLCADRLGRNGVGVELNPAYAVMARNRLTDDCPLFADVAD